MDIFIHEEKLSRVTYLWIHVCNFTKKFLKRRKNYTPRTNHSRFLNMSASYPLCL